MRFRCIAWLTGAAGVEARLRACPRNPSAACLCLGLAEVFRLGSPFFYPQPHPCHLLQLRFGLRLPWHLQLQCELLLLFSLPFGLDDERLNDGKV